MKDKAESYLQTIRFRLNKYILPVLGAWPLKEITSGNILQVCRRIEDTGHDETAKRVKTVIGQIYRYAIAAGYTDSDPTSALLGALRPRNNQHYATLTNSADIAILMLAMRAYPYTMMRCDTYEPIGPRSVIITEFRRLQGSLTEQKRILLLLAKLSAYNVLRMT